MTGDAPRPKTRERLLDATVELLRTKGPAASGTAEILTRADAPRGSFYFHFPEGKDQLVTEALDRAAASTTEVMRGALEDRSVPLPQRVESFLRAVAAGLAVEDYRLGCAVGATALEAAATSPLLQAATGTAFASWTSAWAEHLVAEGVAPDHAAALADTIVAGWEGATMMSRARRDTTALEHVATTLGALVAAALDSAPGPAPASGRRPART